MAIFACSACDHQAHFSEFKVDSDSPVYEEDDNGEEVEVDEVECPECGSSACYET